MHGKNIENGNVVQQLENTKDCALDMRGTVKLIDFGMSKLLWWNVSGKFLEERNKCGNFVCLFCFCFGGRFLMASFIPFLLGRGETGIKGVKKRWKGESNWMYVVMYFGMYKQRTMLVLKLFIRCVFQY